MTFLATIGLEMVKKVRAIMQHMGCYGNSDICVCSHCQVTVAGNISCLYGVIHQSIAANGDPLCLLMVYSVDIVLCAMVGITCTYFLHNSFLHSTRGELVLEMEDGCEWHTVFN